MTQTRPFESCLELPVKRPEKPRDRGLNWLIDWGKSVTEVEGLIETIGAHVDLVKMPALSTRLLPREFLQRKLELYKQNDIRIFPGGMLLEAALVSRALPTFLEEAKDVGFDVLEVSESETSIVFESKLELIRMCVDAEFKVLAELGPHHADKPFHAGETIRECSAYLEAGAWKVILEGEVIQLMKPWENAAAGDTISSIVKGLGLENVIFELVGGSPKAAWWFVQKFGPDVNLGNAGNNEHGIMIVEHIRRGLRGGNCWYGRFASL